jgi:hypothetical protein
MNWTREQYEEYIRNRDKGAGTASKLECDPGHGAFCPNVKCGSWKAAWREIGGMRKFYRSQWEANYARYLEFQKQRGLIKEWKHECETFWFDGLKRGCVSYLPDFKVTLNDGSVEYHEVKGWMDSASKTKIKRMAKYHPEIKLRIFDGKWYKENSRKLSGIIKDWECTRPDTYRSPSGKGGNRGNNHNH